MTRNLVKRNGLLATGMALAVCLATAQTRLPKPSPLYGTSGVSALAVRQGLLGSCYFHASVAAMASTSPDAIRNAIRPDDSGAFRVHFFDGQEEAVYPDDLAYAETHSYDRSDGQWVRVLMRAYAQRILRRSLAEAIERSATIPAFLKSGAHSAVESSLVLTAYDRAIRSVVSQNGALDKTALQQSLAAEAQRLGVPASAAQMAGGFLEEKGFFDSVATSVRQNGEFFGAYRSFGQGGIPSEVLRAFLGSAHAGPSSDRQHTIEQLRRLNGNVAMVAETGSSGPAGDWWVPTHAYTVLGYDEASQMVRLRNPWGARPDPDGTFRIPLSVFFEAFEVYSAAGQ